MLEHRLAKLAAGAAFLLLIIGGTVNPTGSSLACPEPTLVCHGQVFPEMTGGVFYEHGHRLAAMTVGLLQIALTITLLLRRKQLKRLAWITMGMVVAQGALGAVTVWLKLSPAVSSGHLILGMSYMATLIYVAFRTAPGQVDGARRQRAARATDARPWILMAAGAILIQLLLGGLVRHLGATLSCLGMPACTVDGTWWAETGLQKLQMIHRGWGLMVAIITSIAAVKVWRAAHGWTTLRRMAGLAPVLVLAQVVLGIYVVLTMRSVPVAVGHFAGAAGLWALWMSMWFVTSPRALASEVADVPLTSGLVHVEVGS
ncbi:MAG: COX15/CtaA family protein [Deltaproteobacteria bacterium]|nr:COX15/CtaA family protein [Deltaproteobacteria bacterium]